MQHLEGNFQGYKNLNLYYQCWLPDGKPKALLLLGHGLAEHSGRYKHLAGYFVAKGYAVYSFDYRGHGKSEGLGGYVERFSYYLNDFKTFFDIVSRQHNESKVFIIGHSMGGTIATAYAAHHQQELAGLILSGASLKVGSSLSPALIMVANALSVLLPKTGIAVLDASAISRSATVVNDYVNDPLVYRGKIRARLSAEVIRVMQQLPRRMPEINLPILIMHGSADRLSAPEGSEILYQRIGSKDKTLKLYEGFYHEIFNEPGYEQVFTDMESWLTARV